MNNNNTSFWQFLENHQKIEIPIIQRDYAQGRIGNENLRKRFLEQLKLALDSERIALDFVYGIEDKTKTFCPIDGQQRLTTLWLLHWYIAFRSKKLQEENIRNTLQKFTYETRISSREFCSQLCKMTGEDYIPEESIIDYIHNQTWFLSQWQQDPTIQAMLVMLGGTGQADGITDLWGKSTDREMQGYWEKLSSPSCPITFFQSVISSQEMPASDDLYIKMNARGKQLSNFENFKADLIAFWKREKEDSSLIELESNLDNKWIDVFWNSVRDKNKVDDAYFAFFNRYLLNTFISEHRGIKTNIRKSDVFQHLYGFQGDDNGIKYKGFDIYEQIILQDTDARIGKILENYSKIGKEITSYFPQWVNEEFSFIPTDNEDNKISTLTQVQRVVFYAICRFLEEVDKFDGESFRKWMRVIWNIVANAYMDIDSMIGHIQLVNDLSKGCLDIYNYLQNLDVAKLQTEVSQEQLNEEIAKSKHLLDYPNETKQIQEAENYAFFKGVIRFLFTDARGDMNDWADFNTKWQNVQKYFDTKGVSAEYKKEAKLFRRLLSHYTGWKSFSDITYDFEIKSWEKILTHASNKSPVHCLLMKDDVLSYDYSSFKSSIEDPKQKFTQEYLVHSSALEQIIPGCTIHWRGDWGRGCYALYPSNIKVDWKKYLLHQRNNILCDKRFSFNDQWLEKCRNSTLFFGIHINFIYNNRNFQWWGTPNEKEVDIYLMDEDYKDYLKLDKELKENAPDEENYYCFRVDGNESVNSFCKKLDNLINKYHDIINNN